MTIEEVLQELKAMGSEQTRKIFASHGAPLDTLYGVKVGDMKKLLKPLKGQQEIALALYETGISDAMYLAALVADGRLMTRTQLDHWAASASWHMISEYSVAWVASESPFALELALKWIDDPREHVATAGWNTLSNCLAMLPDDQIERSHMVDLLNRIVRTISTAPNRVRYCMNGFIISLGGYVRDLSPEAIAAAKKIGKVEVQMGKTSCNVPDAAAYIQKMIDHGPVKKKKTAKC